MYLMHLLFFDLKLQVCLWHYMACAVLMPSTLHQNKESNFTKALYTDAFDNNSSFGQVTVQFKVRILQDRVKTVTLTAECKYESLEKRSGYSIWPVVLRLLVGHVYKPSQDHLLLPLARNLIHVSECWMVLETAYGT